jgi:hypothetical protein
VDGRGGESDVDTGVNRRRAKILMAGGRRVLGAPGLEMNMVPLEVRGMARAMSDRRRGRLLQGQAPWQCSGLGRGSRRFSSADSGGDT